MRKIKKDEEFTLNIFPWDNKGEKPYNINEEGWEWWVDINMTEYATKKNVLNNTRPLKAACFFLRKGDFFTRVLIGPNQLILHEDTTLEGMACKIDWLRLVNTDKRRKKK